MLSIRTIDISRSYNDPTDSDLKVKIGDKIIYVHKVFLRAASKVFKGGLESNMREVTKGVFEFPELDPVAAEHVFRWIYGINIIVDSGELWCKIFRVADYLDLPELIKYLTNMSFPPDLKVADIAEMAGLCNSVSTMRCAVVEFNNRLIPFVKWEKTGKTEGVVDLTAYKRKVIELASELVYLDYSTYVKFREQWNLSEYMSGLLLQVDCEYASANSSNQSEAMDMLKHFIKGVPFNIYDINDIREIMRFPVIKDDDLVKHLLNCIILIKISTGHMKPTKRSVDVLPEVLNSI